MAGQGLHLDQDLGDEMGEALHHGRLAVMRFRRGDDGVEPESLAQVGGQRPGAASPDRANDDFQSLDAAARALRAEHGMRADDIDIGRQFGEHFLRGNDFDGADIEHHGAWTQIRIDRRDDRAQGGHGRGENDGVAGGDFGQRPQGHALGRVGDGGIIAEQWKMRAKMRGGQPAEGAEANQSDGRPRRSWPSSGALAHDASSLGGDVISAGRNCRIWGIH